MKKLRVLLCLVFAAVFVPWGVSCKKAEESPAIFYDLQLAYEPESRVLTGEETFVYENRRDSAPAALKFNLYPNAYREDAVFRPVSESAESAAYYAGKSYGKIEILSVTGGGEWAIEGEDCNLLCVSLLSPLDTGDRVTLKISFAATLPMVNHRFGVSESAVNCGNFYPILCGVYGNGFYENTYACEGDPFVSDCADYSVSLTLPKTYVAAASGREISSSAEKNGQKTYVYEGKNMRDFAFVCSGKFKVAECKAKTSKRTETAVKYYYTEDAEPQKTLRAARESLEYFSKTYGAYPYETYSVAQTEFCYVGMEYPALSMISSGLSEKEKNYVTAHETAHQWWYGIVGSNAAEEAWQDEGLAEYSAACFFGEYTHYGIEKSAPIQSAEKEYHAYYDVYSRVFHGADTRMSRSLRDYAGDYEYRAIAYDKGLMLFCALENAVGGKRTEKALRFYAEACAYKIAAPCDLIAAFEKAGADVSGLVNAYLSGEAIV